MPDISWATSLFLSRMQEHCETLGVIGVVLVGSKSRGYGDHRSDDDLEVILSPAMHAQRAPSACMEQYFEQEQLLYDVRYLSLRELARKRFSPYDWNHWPYEQAVVCFDREQQVQDLAGSLGGMSASFRQKRILLSTVSTTIAVGKACKALQRGYEAAGRMTVARGAQALSRLVFALEWRWVPPDHWLERDAQTLRDPAHVVPLLVEALKTGNPLALKQAIQQLEQAFPNDVPEAKERAKHYAEVMHATRWKERAVHLLF